MSNLFNVGNGQMRGQVCTLVSSSVRQLRPGLIPKGNNLDPIGKSGPGFAGPAGKPFRTEAKCSMSVDQRNLAVCNFPERVASRMETRIIGAATKKRLNG
jgi:hypothetical protein